MNNFSIKYNGDRYEKFINEVLEFSNKDDKYGFAYPAWDNVKEMKSEIELYNNTLDKSVCIVFQEDKPMGFSGFLYTEGEDEGYLIGPFLKKEYYTKEKIKAILELVLQRKEFKKLIAVPNEKNSIINECYKEMNFSFVKSEREMCFHIIENKEKEVKYKVTELSNKEIEENKEFFNILNQTFNWNNDRDSIEDFLQDEYKAACIFCDNKIIGIVVFAYLKDVDFARLEYLVVVEKYRKRGIGEALINYVINDCNKYKVKKLYLSTGIENEAVNLYKKCGFCDTIISNIYCKEDLL